MTKKKVPESKPVLDRHGPQKQNGAKTRPENVPLPGSAGKAYEFLACFLPILRKQPTLPPSPPSPNMLSHHPIDRRRTQHAARSHAVTAVAAAPALLSLSRPEPGLLGPWLQRLAL